MRQVKNFPFRPPGKTVVDLSNITLPHPEKGDIVNIRPSTTILNLAGRKFAKRRFFQAFVLETKEPQSSKQ